MTDNIEETYFWTLKYDANDETETDYQTNLLMFLDIFTDARIDVKIGDKILHLPKSWNILCADKFVGDAEMISPLSPGFNERDFSAFSLNPQFGFSAKYLPIEVISLMPETKWTLPRMAIGNLLAVPLTDDPKGDCVYITHQQNYKIPEILDIGFIVS